MKVVNLNEPIKSGMETTTLLELLPKNAGAATFGVATFGPNIRHPKQSLAAHDQHEVSYIIEGRLELHTERENIILEAGQLLWLEPDELHASTSLAESKVFYILYD